MKGAVERMLGRQRETHEGYVFCDQDGYWFRPAYTEGKCPLCGAPAVGATVRPPDRSWYGMAGLALESVAMLTLVLVMYFRG